MAKDVISRILTCSKKGIFRADQRPVGIILVVLVLTMLALPALAYNFSGCNSCHEAKLSQDNLRFYLHTPYASQQCGSCHAATVPTPKKGKTARQKSAGKRINLRKVSWLGDSAVAEANHAFVLPSAKMGETLVVEAQGNDGTFARQEIAVPLLADLVEVKDNGSSPVISGAQVLNVRRGVFLSVTIGWQTDSLADGLVRYGIQELAQTSEVSKRFGHQHQVVLYNLKPDQSYRFVVVSKDLFGHSQVSEPATFSTEKPLTTELPASQEESSSSGNGIGISSSFQRFGRNYLLELSLTQPASIYVGSKGAVRRQRQSSATAVSIKNDEPHAGLSSEIVSSMKACRNCHQNQNTATHPVNVYPKPGMTIPPEYPTLPDGRITCRSCHTLHSSDFEYLVRKRGKRELCVGCHKDML